MSKKKQQAVGGATLSLAQLIPQQDNYVDSGGNDPNETGETYPFKSQLNMTPGEMAKAINLQRNMDRLVKKLAKNPRDPAALNSFTRTSIEGLRMILPDMPIERIKTIGFSQRWAIFSWWGDRNKAASPTAEDDGTGDDFDDQEVEGQDSTGE